MHWCPPCWSCSWSCSSCPWLLCLLPGLAAATSNHSLSVCVWCACVTCETNEWNKIGTRRVAHVRHADAEERSSGLLPLRERELLALAGQALRRRGRAAGVCTDLLAVSCHFLSKRRKCLGERGEEAHDILGERTREGGKQSNA